MAMKRKGKRRMVKTKMGVDRREGGKFWTGLSKNDTELRKATKTTLDCHEKAEENPTP